MNPAELSPTQAELVAHMRVHNFPLIRLPGGFWTTTDILPPDGTVPEIWWGTRTVEALLKKGVLYNETAMPTYKGRLKLRTV